MIEPLFSGKTLNLWKGQHLIVVYSGVEQFRKRYLVESISKAKYTATLWRLDMDYQPGSKSNIYFPERLRVHVSYGMLVTEGTEKHNKNFDATVVLPVAFNDGCMDGPTVQYHYKNLDEAYYKPSYGYGFTIPNTLKGGGSLEGRLYAYCVDGKMEIVLDVNDPNVEVRLQCYNTPYLLREAKPVQ
jgi:hypothetical protein